MTPKFKQGIARPFRYLYLKLFRINDSPQKISLGFGLGVFLGVFPGVGPLAALLFSFLFRVNRAAAVIGSLLTNTWISIVVFGISVKTGSALFGLDWISVRNSWAAAVKERSISRLMELHKAAIAVITGYIIISLAVGVIAYAAALMSIVIIKRGKKKVVL